MYSFNSRVRYSEVGEDKKLTLNGVINYFQDCSTFQSEMLNNGVERQMCIRDSSNSLLQEDALPEATNY